MYKKTGLTLAALMIAGSILAACGDGKENTSGNAGNAEANTGGENTAPSGEQVLRMNITGEPPAMDPAQMQDAVSGMVADGLFEGLEKVDQDGLTVPGIAEDVKVSDDGKTYTFTLRKDAKWSSGNPVTAQDFEYAWKRTLDPKLDPPAPYAYQLYYLEGAEAYNTDADGKVSADTVGVKALDDYTLEVKLVNPTTYFLGLTSFYTYFPVDKLLVEQNPKWANEAASYSSNGPFKLKSWEHNASMEIVPNENYYDKDKVKLTSVQFSMMADSNTELQSYNTNKLDWAGAPNGTIPLPQLKKFREEKNPDLQVKDIASTYYYLFNTTKKPFDNVKVRKALAMSIDRQLLVDKVTLGGQKPAYGYVPPSILGVSKSFREETQDTFFKEDVEEAKKLLAEGLAEEGMTSLPETTLIYNTSDAHKSIAEAIAAMWKQNLGVDVKLGVQEFKVFLQNRKQLNYDIARAGWSADYNDPMTFLDMWVSNGGNNDSGFKNEEYDRLIEEAKKSTDVEAREKMLAQAEKILIEDQMAILPLYYYTSSELVKPYVKNIFVSYNGSVNYNEAFIAK